MRLHDQYDSLIGTKALISSKRKVHVVSICADAWIGMISIFCGYSRFRVCSRYERLKQTLLHIVTAIEILEGQYYAACGWVVLIGIVARARRGSQQCRAIQPSQLWRIGLWPTILWGFHGSLSSHMAKVLLVLPCKQSPKQLLAIVTNWSEDFWIGVAYH
jgi:hypothetical protein